MRWALVIEGSVREITEIDPAGRFHPSLEWVEAGADVEPGWQYDGSGFTPPPAPQPAPITTDHVDAERDRRIDGGMVWNGVMYQTRPQDRENVAGASILALAAIGNGAQPGDLRWHGEDTDFVWIAEDNSLNTMDAQTFFAFAQAMAKHKSAHIFAARAIKDIAPIPEDYATNETYWL